MKKILALGLVLLLTLSLLTACGGNNSNSGNGNNTGDSATPASSDADSNGSEPASNDTEGETDNSSPKAIKDVIKASALISLEDAAAMLGQDMTESKPFERHFVDEARYKGEDFSFSVSLLQEVLHDKDNDLENNLLKNGWAVYLQKMEGAYAKNNQNQNIIQISGISGTSYLQEGEGFGQWLLHIFYGDYYIILVLGHNTGVDRVDGEDEVAWKHEKLTEAGKLAIERLKAIVG